MGLFDRLRFFPGEQENALKYSQATTKKLSSVTSEQHENQSGQQENSVPAPGTAPVPVSREQHLEDLQRLAQLAMQVEFATIPVYLAGLYSMKKKDNAAYQALRSVVMEEMLHFNQAANLVVALGAQPKITGDSTPTYPSYLPKANPATTPYLGLYRASKEVFSSVYTAIETPAVPSAPAQGDQYDTIAQLYAAFLKAIDDHDATFGNPFAQRTPGIRQRTDIYIGKFGGKVIEVVDKNSAHAAIRQIVQQGEGTVPTEAPLDPMQEYGAYQHYGQRTDGTYGPIMGTPYEMSHFSKFRHVSLDPSAFPPTFPIISNPKIEQFTNPEAKKLANLFNDAYTQLLEALEDSFKDITPTKADPFFGIALNLMHRVLPGLAESLMETPISASGDASVGPNAAPTWSCVPRKVRVSSYASLQGNAQEGLQMGPQESLAHQTREAINRTQKGIENKRESAAEDARRRHVASVLEEVLRSLPKVALPV